MKRLALLLAIVTALALNLSCNRTPEAKGKPRIALVMKALSNEFFKTMQQGAEKHHADRSADYELISNGIPNETDVNAQVKLVEQMIADHVDAIVIAPADSKALIKVCKEAQKAGIVVINIDNKFDVDALSQQGVKIPFIGPDNRKGARMAGEYLGKKLQEGDTVMVIGGIPTAENGKQRSAGFSDAIASAKLKSLDEQSGKWQTKDANDVATSILGSHAELKAFLCANDNMALGAVAALRAAGRLDQVKVIGFDNINDVRTLIKEGKVLCTVDQHGDQLAAFGIDYAMEVLKNKSQPADKETPVDLITAESIK